MKSKFHTARSIWQKYNTPGFSKLSGNLECDICVIGAGIGGLTTAYLLAKEGYRVVVLDREARLGLHETGLSSAHLSNVWDDQFYKLQKLHGTIGARLAAQSHGAAISFIEDMCSQKDIECDFQRVDGYLFLDDDHDLELFRKEIDAARSAGLTDLELISRAPNPIFDTGPCLRFPRQAQFHPLKYLSGLANAFIELGGAIYTETPATKIEYGDFITVTSDEHCKVKAYNLVVATNSPINDTFTMHTKLAAYRTYVIGIEIPRGMMEPMLMWDTADPYHYIRLLQDSSWNSDILIVGGEDHRTGQDMHPEDRYQKLQEWVQERMGLNEKVSFRWSGQILEPFDTVAYIGKNPGNEERVYILTGDSGQGLTHGTLGGMILRDLIMNRQNPWAEFYNPARKSFKSWNEYVRENFNSVTPYSDWVAPGDVDSPEEIEPGEGAIIRHGFKKLACYRDKFGILHVFSAACPHLGGVVRWNNSEKTWDCPCHGSRFHSLGEVLNGPAPHGLKPLEETGEDLHIAPAP